MLNNNLEGSRVKHKCLGLGTALDSYSDKTVVIFDRGGRKSVPTSQLEVIKEKYIAVTNGSNVHNAQINAPKDKMNKLMNEAQTEVKEIKAVINLQDKAQSGKLNPPEKKQEDCKLGKEASMNVMDRLERAAKESKEIVLGMFKRG